jgi:hypothetical protein
MFSLNFNNVPSVANLWNTNPTQALAGFIQGEAGNQGVLGMQAVAGVMGNRTASDFNGYGSSLQSQLMQASQFQGWQTPSPQAIAVAQQLQNGTLVDPTWLIPLTQVRLLVVARMGIVPIEDSI